MLRPDQIDFFELADTILKRLNESTNFKLSQHDISLKLKRDIDFPSDKFNIYLILFNQEIAVTYYTTVYNTIPKIVNILFTHLLDDGGFESIEHAILSTKRYQLEEMLNETKQEIDALFRTKQIQEFNLFVDENYPIGKIDEKGLPIYELNIHSKAPQIDIKIELNNQYFGLVEKQKVLEKVNSILKNY